MPQPKGKCRVSKCTFPNPITSVIQEVNGVKRKITAAAKPLGIAKKFKEGLQYNPAIVSPLTSATRDKDTPTTTAVISDLSHLEEEPLKFQELQNIKKVRNWKPPPLRKQDQVELSKKDSLKPKDVKKCQQRKSTMKKGKKVISTLVSSDMLTQKEGVIQSRNSDLVDEEMFSGEVNLTTKYIENPSPFKDIGNNGIAKVANQEMPLQLSPCKLKLVNNETDEFIIGDSQPNMKTVTNSQLVVEILSECAVVVDLTKCEIKQNNSQDEDLFEGEEEMFNETQKEDTVIINLTESLVKETNSQEMDLFEGEEEMFNETQKEDTVIINLTESLVKETNSQEMDLFEGEDEIYTKQYDSLKLNIHNAISTKFEENDNRQLCRVDKIKEITSCNGITDDSFVAPVEEAFCTPTNDVNLQDITPPTVKRIPHKEHNYTTDEIGTVNKSQHMEVTSLVCNLTTDPLLVTPTKMQKLSTFEETPKLLTDTVSDATMLATTNVLSQTKGTNYVPSTCQKSQNEMDNILSQKKGMNCDIPTNNDIQKSQNEASNALASTQNTKGPHNFHGSEYMTVENNDGTNNASKPIINNGNREDNVNSVTQHPRPLTLEYNGSQQSLNGSNSAIPAGKGNKDHLPTQISSQTLQNGPDDNNIVLNNDVKPHSMILNLQYNESQKSQNVSNGVLKPSKEIKDNLSAQYISSQTSQNGPGEITVTPHATPQYNAKQTSQNVSNSVLTPSKEIKDNLSAQYISSQTITNGPGETIVIPHATPQHNASQTTNNGSDSAVMPSQEIKDLPSAHFSSQTSQNAPNSAVTPIKANDDLLSVHSTKQEYQNRPNNISTPKINFQSRTSPSKKDGQTSKSLSDNVCPGSNDVKENRQPYLYEMDQDFDLISSSQLLAIEDEVKREMLQESAHNRAKPNERQIAPQNVPAPRAPVFSIATMPPLRPFDWTKQVRDDRQRLRGIVQEMTLLNTMITNVRREMWPGRRPDEASSRVGSGTMPPPQVGPSAHGSAPPPGNWGRGHRY